METAPVQARVQAQALGKVVLVVREPVSVREPGHRVTQVLVVALAPVRLWLRGEVRAQGREPTLVVLVLALELVRGGV